MTDGSKTIILRATHLLTQRDIRPDVQWLNLRSVALHDTAGIIVLHDGGDFLSL